MKELTADDILGAQDIECERVEVPEWGGVIYIGLMNAEARDEYERGLISDERDKDGGVIMDYSNMRAKLVAATVADKNGNRLFSESQINALGKKSSAVMVRLYDIAAKINLLNDDGIEQAAKN
jgi:hypothetical protein